MTKRTNRQPKSGDTILIPLNRLKKSPKNVRRVPHAKQHIAELAASIAAKGMLQSPVVEPERDRRGRATGYYLVTIGEGRRLAQLRRVKRNEIAKDEPVRCLVDTEHAAEEISLAENMIRAGMHPADQYQAFAKLHHDQGLTSEEIATRFGVTAAVVKQRLKLGAVSPRLIQAYRRGKLCLEELMAFTLTDDHARQQEVWQQVAPLSGGRRAIIRALTEDKVPAGDRRAVFVGEKAYRAAGGNITRDLFDAEGGYFDDAALLDRLVREKLEEAAHPVLAEGWKWVAVQPEFDYAAVAAMRRLRPLPITLDAEQQAALDALELQYDDLAQQDDGENTASIEAQLAAMEDESVALTGGERYEPDDIATAGAFIVLGGEGELRIERGFVRREDAANDAPAEPAETRGARDADADAEKGTAPISDRLAAELTAERTAALRDALGQQPDIALLALTHALALATFSDTQGDLSCLEVMPRRPCLSTHAPAIDSGKALQAVMARHAAWEQRLPDDPALLWSVLVHMQENERLKLLAHCVSLTANAVLTKANADGARFAPLATALNLDMARYWCATSESYFGRVSKQRILDAVREGVSPQAADNLAKLKKEAMAAAAAQRLAGTNWLPELLRGGAAREEAA